MVKEGDLLWTPTPEWVANANVTAFMQWLQSRRSLTFANYDELWRWSVSDLDAFWGALWDYFQIESSAPFDRVLGSRRMPGAEWFSGSRLNYAQHILRRELPGTDALMFLNETSPLGGVRWEDLAGQVRILATQLRRLGVKPGDRVVA